MGGKGLCFLADTKLCERGPVGILSTIRGNASFSVALVQFFHLSVWFSNLEINLADKWSEASHQFVS